MDLPETPVPVVEVLFVLAVDAPSEMVETLMNYLLNEVAILVRDNPRLARVTLLDDRIVAVM